MADFAHLRVASGYSFKYGANHPEDLVQQAAENSMSILGITDRDGLYGAIRFVNACTKAGVKPVVGVDFAVTFEGLVRVETASVETPSGGAPLASPRASVKTSNRTGLVSRSQNLNALQASTRPVKTPTKGGLHRREDLPRVVVLALGQVGWISLCRLVSAAHDFGGRGRARVTLELLENFFSDGQLVALLGSDSTVGKLVSNTDYLLAEDELKHWRAALGPKLFLAVSNRRVGGFAPGSTWQAGKLIQLADRQQVKAVLVNDVRMATKTQFRTLDILDASRNLVPMGDLNPDRPNDEAWLKPGELMLEIAEEASAAGGRPNGKQLLADTFELASQATLSPKDIGIGRVHLPEYPGGPKAALGELTKQCLANIEWRYPKTVTCTNNRLAVESRLTEELEIIESLGFASYFLCVAGVVQMIKDKGIRCAARGSGAGSLVNYLLGISGVDPLAYGLLMERFLSPKRKELPDIDLDVESARRLEIYQMIVNRFGQDRVVCVGMLDTYRVRHAIRDVGAALSMEPNEIDLIAKAFPRVRARQARTALEAIPELRSSGLRAAHLAEVFDLVESLDGLPRQLALHPCGVILGGQDLRDLTPFEISGQGFPVSQFDKDDVERLGLLKLDVLGVRMQSSLAFGAAEVVRTTGETIDLDALAPFDDSSVYEMIQRSQTLGCFQIESPGQRELVGKFGPQTFHDIVIDISLFRPGPVKSDMVTPFLKARSGLTEPDYLHPTLKLILEKTRGVVVFHEQIIQIISVVTGCTRGDGDKIRRLLGQEENHSQIKEWFYLEGKSKGYDLASLGKIWQVLVSFASFGFCEAHAAAFALPTYQSAWLKRHFPAQFLAGVLTYDPGMYPKRLLLNEARRMNIKVLGLDVNHSDSSYRAVWVGEKSGRETGADRNAAKEAENKEFEKEGLRELAEQPQSGLTGFNRLSPSLMDSGLPDASGWGIRISLTDVSGITDYEIDSIISNRPYLSLSDFWARARVSQPVLEKLVMVGGFDALYSQVASRRDLLLTAKDLGKKYSDGRHSSGGAKSPLVESLPLFGASLQPNQLGDVKPSGLPEMSLPEKIDCELEILGLDVSGHVMQGYWPFLNALSGARLNVVAVDRLLSCRNGEEVLVAGVKVATQTPPVRSGKRVVFLSLDDSTGVADAAFFETAQGEYAKNIFGSWQLLVRGRVRRTGKRGISLTGTGAWPLAELYREARTPRGFARVVKTLAGEPDLPKRGAKRQDWWSTAGGRKLWYSSPGSSGG